MVDNLIFSFDLGNLILCFWDLFAVGISIWSYPFIMLLLFFQFVFSLYIFLLELRDQIPFQFDFFQGLKVFSISLSSFFPISFFFFFNYLKIFLDIFNGLVSFINFSLNMNNFFFFFSYFISGYFELSFLS